MLELELLGPHGDGEHLVLTDPQGTRYLLPVDDDLRSAVRREAPRLESLKATNEGELRPRELQTMIRAGATPAEITEAFGVSEQYIERFAGAVLAEREWAANRARTATIGATPDSPQLGDLAVDRLAARGVDPGSLRWDAARHPGEPWEVTLTFIQAANEHVARWSLDQSSGSVRALDDEARWLSETSTPAGTTTAPVHRLEPLSAPPSAHPRGEKNTDIDATDAILSELSRARGVRQSISLELEDLDEEIPAEEEAEVATLPGLPEIPSEEPPAKTRSSRPRRRSVPSWDEIVFGAKSD